MSARPTRVWSFLFSRPSEWFWFHRLFDGLVRVFRYSLLVLNYTHLVRFVLHLLTLIVTTAIFRYLRREWIGQAGHRERLHGGPASVRTAMVAPVAIVF